MSGAGDPVFSIALPDGPYPGLRPFEKYLAALAEIRRIQHYLVTRAGKAGVPVIENTSVDAAVDEVIELVLADVETATGG